jgi:large subunit ribosomal protein L30
MTASTKLHIKLIKSPCGRLPKHRQCVLALGLRKINQIVERDDTPEIRGLINKIYYMVAVEEKRK